MSQDEFTTKVMTDAAFREELKREPAATMRAHGVDVPDGVEIEVVESTPTKHYVVLPPLRSGELSEDDLTAVQGGCSVYINQEP